MLLTHRRTGKPSPFILYSLAFILSFFLTLTWVSAKEKPKPKPQDWQINGIVAALDDGYDQVKKLAFDQLVNYDLKDLKSLGQKPEDIAQKVFNILKDKNADIEVRQSAAYTLGNLGQTTKPYVQNILNILKDKTADIEVRHSAAYVLGNLGEATKPYIPDILKILKDKTDNSSIRTSAGAALGRLGEVSKPFAQEILNILKDKTSDSYVRTSAGAALGRLGEVSKPFAQEILNVLKDKTNDSSVRRSATEALGNLGDSTNVYVEEILNVLKDKTDDSSVRRSAAEALGNLGDATNVYVEEIFNVLKDKTNTFSLRISVAQALGNLGDISKPNIQGILDIIKDETDDLSVRGSLAEALGQFNKNADLDIKKIFDIIKDDTINFNIRARLLEALGKLEDFANLYVQEIINIIKDKSLEFSIRRSAVKSLGKLKISPQQYSKEIFIILKDKTFDVDTRGTQSNFRDSIAFELRNLGESAKHHILEILEMIKNENVDSGVRINMVEALGYWGDTAKPYAKNIANILKDKTLDSNIRASAAMALGQLGNAGEPYIKNIIDFIHDKTVDINTRVKAASALENIGEAVKPYIKDILDLLKDKTVDLTFNLSLFDSRLPVLELLSKIEQLKLNNIVVILDSLYYAGQSELEKWRFWSYFLGGGTDEIKTLLTWLGRPKTTPDKLDHNEGKTTLEVFLKAWEPSKGLDRLREDLAEQISIVAENKKAPWKWDDIGLLQSHYNNLKTFYPTKAYAVQSQINNLEGWQWFFKARNTIIIHITFWLALIFAYPKFPQVQAIFFWNPWVRRILGVGYVGFFLTWVPFFRRKLFEPFKPSLLADAGLDNFHEQSYFPESKVKVPSGDIQPITVALPSIKGQVILQGDSGLGKSMFLRHLLQNSPRIVVYLPAQKCQKGVIEAIQDKLHGQAQDAGFLKNLIYSGAIDICIDGLNEVTAETRAKICQFVESYFRGNIIMTTQPLEWTPPSTAKTYYLQPLEQTQIQEFLLSRQPRLPKDAQIQGKDYEQACINYLNEVLTTQQPPEELNAAHRILSNPMDLTVVALMLSQGKHPNLFRLQEQQYNLMAAEYLQEWNQEFPLKKFSAAVYQMRLQDEQALPADEFYQVVKSLEDEKYKMVVSRQWQDEKGEAKKEWYFRHDKIMDFFLVQNFLGNSDEAEGLLVDRMGDPRFRGVYFLLATLLPLDAAKELREKLIQYAADTKDNTVSNTFVQLLRTR
jgi:HEAT repeat protein